MSDESDSSNDDYGDTLGDEPLEEERDGKRLFERAVPEVFKRLLERALESGVEKLSEGPENLRNLVGELKLPKEALHYVYGQVDDTKKGIYRVVAKELRDVLEHTNFSDEIADVLTKLSFEINTQIRFVPNPEVQRDDDEEGSEAGNDNEESRKEGFSGIPRPRVVSRMVLKAKDKIHRPNKD